MSVQEAKERTNRALDTVVDTLDMLKAIIGRTELYVDNDQSAEVVAYMQGAIPLAETLVRATTNTMEVADDWQAAQSVEAERKSQEYLERLRKEQSEFDWRAVYPFKDTKEE